MRRTLVLATLVVVVAAYGFGQDSDTTEPSIQAGSGLENAMQLEKDNIADSWPEPTIVRRNDEFAGLSITELSMRLRDFADEVRLRFRHVRQDGSTSGDYYAIADLTLSEWMFVDRIYFLADAQRYRVRSVKSESTTEVVSHDTVQESVFFRLTRSILETMASSDEVRVSIRGDRGRRDYSLRDIDLEKLREFVAETTTK